MAEQSESNWQIRDRFLELRSRWLTLIGEHLQDQEGQILEYWRIEKADSVVVVPLQGDRILLAVPSYRPGVGQVTLDFPGGRVAPGQTPQQAALITLERELGVAASEILQLSPLNSRGWAVNSSFSNQQLYGFVAEIDPGAEVLAELAAYPGTSEGVQHLLQQLTCLQCRAVLLEWQRKKISKEKC